MRSTLNQVREKDWPQQVEHTQVQNGTRPDVPFQHDTPVGSGGSRISEKGGGGEFFF